jgi:hypothetical protein
MSSPSPTNFAFGSSDAYVSSGLNNWFAKRLNSLPLTDGADFRTILKTAPFGISTYKVRYSHLTAANGFKRTGASGWTYYPKAADGTRLAKVSYQYLPRDPAESTFHLTTIVNLIDYIETDTTLSWTAGGETYVTLDNFGPHGRTELRHANNKRQKLSIKHEQAD